MHDPEGWKCGSHDPRRSGRGSGGMSGGPSDQEPLAFLEQPQHVDSQTVGVAAGLRSVARSTGPVLDPGTVVGREGKQAVGWHGAFPGAVRCGAALPEPMRLGQRALSCRRRPGPRWQGRQPGPASQRAERISALARPLLPPSSPRSRLAARASGTPPSPTRP